MPVHEGKKPFQCKNCNYSCSSIENMIAHVTSAHQTNENDHLEDTTNSEGTSSERIETNQSESFDFSNLENTSSIHESGK